MPEWVERVVVAFLQTDDVGLMSNGDDRGGPDRAFGVVARITAADGSSAAVACRRPGATRNDTA